MGQRALLMRQREYDAGLVGLGQRPQHVGLVGIAHHQEAGEVMLIVLNVVFQHFQSIQVGGLGMADGSPPLLLPLGNHLGRAGGILGLHILHLRVLGQKLAALHQGYGMGVYLLDGVPVVVRQAADAVGDVQLVLADDGGARVAQQLVVMQQATGNGILDGQHTDAGGVLAHAVKHLFEG